ncbi:MAG: outer membrane protein assembly factor BamE [Xanthomonadales bacterium]|nr:outer membrane protein assembly factor BamE [Xanthomonadales bacterium]
MTRIRLQTLLAAALATLAIASGCNLVYKQNIQQGNALEQEDLDELQLGMTRNQVLFVMGTPAVRDPFHQDRWDYIHTFSRRGSDPLKRKVTLYFEGDRLVRMEGVEDELAEDLSQQEGGETPGNWAVDVVLSDSQEDAVDLAGVLRLNGFHTVVLAREVDGVPHWLVRCPDQATREEARRLKNVLEAEYDVDPKVVEVTDEEA